MLKGYRGKNGGENQSKMRINEEPQPTQKTQLNKP